MTDPRIIRNRIIDKERRLRVQAKALVTRAQRGVGVDARGRKARLFTPALPERSRVRELREALDLRPVPPMRPVREGSRTVMIRPVFTPGDAEDIRAIAAGWGVPVGTAVWAIVRSRLDVWRRRALPELGAPGLAIEAGLGVLLGRDPVQRATNQAGLVEDSASGSVGNGLHDGPEAGPGGPDRRDEG